MKRVEPAGFKYPCWICGQQSFGCFLHWRADLVNHLFTFAKKELSNLRVFCHHTILAYLSCIWLSNKLVIWLDIPKYTGAFQPTTLKDSSSVTFAEDHAGLGSYIIIMQWSVMLPFFWQVGRGLQSLGHRLFVCCFFLGGGGCFSNAQV